MVHFQADGAAVLSLQAAVAARGPARRLPLLSRGHQAAEHRHPGARPAAAAAPVPARPARHGPDGAALMSSERTPPPAYTSRSRRRRTDVLRRVPVRASRLRQCRADAIRARPIAAALPSIPARRRHVPGGRGLRGPRARRAAASAAWVRAGRPHPPLSSSISPGRLVGPGGLATLAEAGALSAAPGACLSSQWGTPEEGLRVLSGTSDSCGWWGALPRRPAGASWRRPPASLSLPPTSSPSPLQVHTDQVVSLLPPEPERLKGGFYVPHPPAPS